MASTSAHRPAAGYARIKNASTTFYSENQTLLSEIRKATNMMKEAAIDLERDNMSELVKELEDGFLELVEASEDCTNLSNAIQSVGNEYRPGPEVTNFHKVFADKLKAAPPSNPEKHPWLRQFREAIWNVHHAGQVMPGDDQEDIVMTSSHITLLNITCPLSGKPVIQLSDPVRSIDCKHIYEKNTVLEFIRSKGFKGRCPVTGCPKHLRADRVLCDPLLLIEIDEMRTMNKQAETANEIEDFTGLDED